MKFRTQGIELEDRIPPQFPFLTKNYHAIFDFFPIVRSNHLACLWNITHGSLDLPYHKDPKILWVRNKHFCNLCGNLGSLNSFLPIESCEMRRRGRWKTPAKLPGKDRVVKCKLEAKTRSIMHTIHFQDYQFKKHGWGKKLKEVWRWKPWTLGGEVQW